LQDTAQAQGEIEFKALRKKKKKKKSDKMVDHLSEPVRL